MAIKVINYKSISFRVIVLLIALITPIIAIMVYNNAYSVSIIHSQVAESNKNMLALYMNQIDANLDVVDNYLSTLIISDSFDSVANSNDDNSDTLAKAALLQQMSRDIHSFSFIDALFLFDSDKQELIYSQNTGNNFDERARVNQYIKADMIKTLRFNQDKKWVVQKIGDQYYLFRVLQVDNLFMGAWLNVKRLMIPLDLIDLGEKGTSVLVSMDNKAIFTSRQSLDSSVKFDTRASNYYFTGVGNEYLAVGKKSNSGEFVLFVLIEDSSILEKLPYLQYIANAISFLTVLLVALCILLIKQIVLRPLDGILATVKKIQNGDLNARIRARRQAEEFQIVDSAINNMLDQIRDLKIDVYEEQIEKQKFELDRLQLQIKPHFYLNALNSIHSFAKIRRYDLILNLSNYLINHFRYILKSNVSFVFLRDEVAHIRNYMKIQIMRYSELLGFHVDIPEYLLELPVPPFILQTFVENSIKYGVDLNKPATIKVVADLINQDDAVFLHLTIDDDGQGFAPDVLDRLSLDEPLVDENNVQHIGIWNIRKRMTMLYGSTAILAIGNQPDGSGAHIDIRLPMSAMKVGILND
jgi:two-component system, sensor histidine kinase YesM